MFVLGITGGSGSGKSYICKFLRNIGYYVIDADQIAREIVLPDQPALLEIIGTFGKGVLYEDGSLNRKKLGSIVFADSEKLKSLNRITHKYIIERIAADLEMCKNQNCIIDAPLLYTCGLDALCDAVVGVTAGSEIRAERIVLRDGISEADAINRIKSQSEIEEHLKNADLVLDTSSNPPVEFLAKTIQDYIEGVCNE